MKHHKLLPALIALFVLLGCMARPKPTPPRIVTQIIVTCEGCSSLSRKYFNTDEKMQLILRQIRSIGIQDTPHEDPEMMKARTIQISLVFSDGSRKLYTQKSDRYFREESGPWKEIDPENARNLYLAILLTPSDEEVPQLMRPHPIRLPGMGIFPG
jgi:hypothetical protein